MDKKLKIWVLALLLGFCCHISFAQESYVEGALYVKFKNGSINYAKSPNRNYNIQHLFNEKSSMIISNYAVKSYAYSMHLFGNKDLDGVFRIEFDSIGLTEEFIEELGKDPRIILIEKVPMQHIPVIHQEDPAKIFFNDNSPAKKRSKSLPNDTYLGLIDGIQSSWYLDVIGFSDIYGNYQGNPNVKVAVVDNAVWGEHEDLQIAYDNLYDTYIGMEGTAKPPKVVDQDATPSGDLSAAYGWSHGTHCAGVIAAITNNQEGIPSMADGVTLMGVKTAENNFSDLARTIQGVIWAAENGAKVISTSFGSETTSTIERNIYESCVKQGIIMVASAGNNGAELICYPANYKGVISVTSVDSDLKKSSFSNYGTWVDIAAPGGYYVRDNGTIDEHSQILSTTFCVNQTLKKLDAFKGKYYDQMAGTSMATPIVSSLVSLILSYYPDLNGYQMLEILQRSATAVSSTDLPIAPNSGVIHAPNALNLVERLQNKNVVDLTASYDGVDNIVKLTWSEPQEKNGLSGYQIYAHDSLISTTENNSFLIDIQDTSKCFFGVQAVYESENGLISYARIDNFTDIHPAISNKPSFFHYFSPSGQTIYLSSDHDIQNVSIFDLQGKLLLEKDYDENGINITHLQAGVYILRAKQSSGMSSLKFFL